MINITDIPHLRAYQPTSTIPKRNGESNKGVLVFLSSPSLDKTTTMLDGKHITNTSVRNYYVERNYHEKIGSRTEHLLLTMSDVPERFKTAPSTVVTRVNSLENLPTGSNRFIDLAVYNKLFFKVLNETSMTYTTICREYMSMLKRAIVQTQYNIFPEKLLMINLDDWEDYSAKEFGRADSLNNPAAIIYYALYKFPDLIKELGNINIIFYSQNSGYKVRINPSMIDGDSARRFRNEVSRVSPTSNRLMSGDFDTQLREEEVRNSIVDTFGERYNLVGDTDDKTTQEIKKVVKKSVEDKDGQNPDSIEETKDTIADEVDNDKELASKVSKIIQTNKVGKSATSSKRDAQLRKRQAELKIGDSTLGEILETKTANAIPVDNIGDKLSTTNANMYNVRFTNFEKAYNDQLMQKDIMSMVTALNDTRLPVHVRSVKVEDKSDELNYVDRYYIQLEDENRVRHQLTFDMPKFIDDKFMYLHGNRKEIVKQQLMLPIVKARPNEVQIVSNYKKIFVRREGDKISPKLEKFKKFMSKSPEGFKVKEGNSTSSNRTHVRTIEFDELAKKYEYIDFGSGKLFFNLNKVEEMCADKKKSFTIEKDGIITDVCVGFYKGKQNTDEPIYLNVETQKIAADMDIVDFLLTFAKDDQVAELKKLSAGKRYMFTGATLMRKRVPIALLVAYHEGLSGLLRKVGVKYYFTDKRPKVGLNERVIQFEDGFLVYEEGTMDQTLIMNGLSIVPTRAYKFEEFDDKDVYLDIFDSMFKQRNIASAFDNFYDFMIDPITKEILDDMDLPTNYVDVLIYASNLLADNAYTEETDLSLYRIRSNEILNSYLYNAVATAYSTYIATADNPNPIKISIPRDTIVKSVLTAQTVEDYSILNPIVEVEKGRAVTAKGPSGANLDQSYTMAKRSYSPSMTGVMAMSSSPDANVGVVRAMSTEPSITSARGYITNNQGRLDELKDVNIFSPGELLSPMGASRDKLVLSHLVEIHGSKLF